MNGADIAFPHLGIYIPSLPKGITIGGFTIAYYGIIIASAMIAGLMLARWQAKRSGQNPEVYMDYIIFGIIFSIIGARLYYVAFQWEDYKDNLLQIFNIRGGGMAIYGSVIGAVLTAIVYCRRKKYKFSLFADTAVLGLILGQIIGRFGNFMNREAFGEYTDSLFAMRLKTDQVSLSNVTNQMWENVVTQDDVSYIQVHPTFLYEAVWNLVVLVLMIWRSKHKKFDGEIFLMYLVGYGIGRTWIEGLRTDQLQIGSTGIAVSQVLSALLAVGGIGYWIYRLIKEKKQIKNISAMSGFFLFLVLLAAPLYLGEGTEARAASPRQEIERSIVREIPSKHKVRKTFYADYDRNGRPEAFVLTGPKKKKNEQAETELTLWFAYVKNGNVVSRKLRQDVLGTSGFLKLQSVTLFRAQTYCTTSGPEDLYRVTGNKVTKIFHGDLMAPWAGDSFTSVHSTYDSAYDKSAGVTLGHTWKPYYFYYKNGKIYEHNGKKITSSRFMRYKNAEKILKRYRKMGKVRSIIYRSNGLIHINFEKKYNDGDKSYSNVTLHVSGNMLKKPVVKEGIYKKKFM
ncbi:MAG: prolipoprotein diacylglyceryl transferase [Eubacterium sp.]|jgi:prolipoprotein diacylglyceryl transferase|nr:prolipoprotein diacylglyceryl transferase [Eubacterium sp.]